MASPMQVIILLLLSVGCLRAQQTAPPGQKGVQGDPGEVGPPGNPGLKGDAGALGQTGEKGAPGLEGNPGINGSQGEVGPPGSDGEPGVMGATGGTGSDGDHGVDGVAGDQGDTGATGATGDTGDEGQPGERGVRGEIGPDGITGAAGDKGEKGEAGILGDSGQKGDQGPSGAPGRSLMELDTNECEMDNYKCDPTSTECINWAIGYTCVCKPGFKSKNSKFECDDVDECATENGACAGTCRNIVGAYVCECPTNTKLTANNQCSDINECLDPVCGDGPDDYCVNNYNGSSCVSNTVFNTEKTAPLLLAQRLSTSMLHVDWMIVLLAWFSVLTFIAVVILLWLIYVFNKMRRDRLRRQKADIMYDAQGHTDGDSDDDMQMPEGMAGSADIHLDLPRPPSSRKGTMKGASAAKGSVKGSRSYKGGGSRPSSVSSSTGKELKIASVKHHRVAAGERSVSNRLSGVDTYY